MLMSLILALSCATNPPAGLDVPASANVPSQIDATTETLRRAARVQRSIFNFNLVQPQHFNTPPTNSHWDVYERQTMRAIVGPNADPAALGFGLAVFAATTVLVARAPASVRMIFDSDLHLGPAILRDGGFGVAGGYRW